MNVNATYCQCQKHRQPTPISGRHLTQDGPQPVQQNKGIDSTTTREWVSLLEERSQETEETEGYRGGLQGKKERMILLDEDTLICKTEDETEVHEEEGEDTLADYGRVQMPQVIKYISKDHDPTNDVVEGDDGDHGYGMAVAAMVFDDEYHDLLFSRIARLYEQLPTRVAQGILPYMFTSPTPTTSSASSSSTFEIINNGDPNTTKSSVTTQAVTPFSQPSKTVSQLWKRWFTSCHASELDRTSIWMLDVYFKNWKEKTLATKEQKEVFEVEKRVVRSVLEKVRDSESADEMLMQGRGNRVESAKEAVEADVMRERGMRRYHDHLGLADGITWKFERCLQIYTKHNA
ncbi:hypothetical protein EC957_007484 [Mortierella hygrophila]|uniref:Uncharacterized protein n=1 Tax=Mortierella hygrophila TaxID=979708 RepID=A0A9P6K625_9FUNG|nr:hypothetical protein EC957_007484 [Mortierella hygrophila]